MPMLRFFDDDEYFLMLSAFAIFSPPMPMLFARLR